MFATCRSQLPLLADQGLMYSGELTIPWRVGFRLEKSDEVLKQVKPLVDDCVNFKSLLFGVDLKDAKTSMLFKTEAFPAVVTVVAAFSCSVEQKLIDEVKKVISDYAPVIFEGQENVPDLFSGS